MLAFRSLAATVLLVLATPTAAGNGNAPKDAGREREVRPITLEAVRPLRFGKLTTDRGLAGSVTVDPAGHKTVHGGARDLGEHHGAAVFRVEGEPRRRFVVLLPQEVPLSGRRLRQARLEAFRSSPSDYGVLDQKGQATVRIGATLHLPAGSTGTFDEPFELVVDYED